MSQQELELPQGWRESNLDALSLIITKGSTPTSYGFSYQKTGINFIKVENIVDGWIDQKTIHGFINHDANEYLKRSQLKEKDVLFSIAGTIGKTTIVRKRDLPANTNQAIAIIRCPWKYLNPKYIRLILDSPALFNLFNLKTRGVGIYNLSLGDIKQLTIPLPPLNEQKRIVSKIEELFSKIDSVKQSLEYTKLQLEQYRQSLLKSAFEGKLMKIENNKIKFIPLNEIGSIITGYTPKTSNSSFYGNDIPFFKPKDLNKGYFVNNSKDKLSTKGIQKARLVPEKSVLITSIGATIGKTGFSRIEGVTNQQINSIIPDSNQILPEFLYFLCISPQFQESILNNASSTTLPIINKSKFSKLEIPLFSIKEQEQMVSQIEQGFSLIENTSQIVKYSLQNLQTMKTSVLKNVFKGKLVPQDPNDEPASVLLQKIKHEKEQLIQKQNTSKVKKNVK